MPIIRHTLIAIIIMTSAVVAGVHAEDRSTTTGFTYQGRLTENGQPVTDEVQLIFRLFDAATGGNQVGPNIVEFDWPVVDGLITIELDFGDVFDGQQLWLDVRVNATQLSPRQKITASPYAIHALNVDGDGGGSPTGPAGGDLSGKYPDPVIAPNAVGSSKLASDPDSLAGR